MVVDRHRVGGLMADTEREPYNLDPAFEEDLVTLLCCRQRLFNRLAGEIHVECLGDKYAQLALQAAKAIAHDVGQGPSSLQIVAQRLRRWKEEGKVTQKQINEVMDIFDEAEDRGLPDEEDVVNEMKPILKRRLQGEAVREAIDTFGKQGEMSDISKKLERSERIGDGNFSTGIALGGALDEIREAAFMERMALGIPELDVRLEGGPERGSLFCFAGGPGDGKSMALVQTAANSMLQGTNVAYLTLELNRARTWARIISNITGIPINALIEGKLDKAERFLADLEHQLGALHVEYFTPQVTTVADMKDYVHRVEDKIGEEIAHVVCDYADKMCVADPKGEYIDMRDVFEGYRIWMEESQRWGTTASQAKRRDSKKHRIIEIDDLADSQHKARVVDGVITLNVGEDEEGDRQCKMHVAKNRNGEAGFIVGPLPCDFACARIAPVNRDYEQMKRKKRMGQQELMR